VNGGGIAVVGSANLVVTNSEISNNANTAVLARGGGVYLSTTGTGTITNARIGAKRGAHNGDGAGFYGGNRGGSATPGACTIADNYGPGANYFGGGVRLAGGTVTLDGCTISGNISEGRGGGVQNSGGTLNIINSTIVGNIAEAGTLGGGGIQISAGTNTI